MRLILNVLLELYFYNMNVLQNTDRLNNYVDFLGDFPPFY